MIDKNIILIGITIIIIVLDLIITGIIGLKKGIIYPENIFFKMTYSRDLKVGVSRLERDALIDS
jgi:hypothetical protein